MTKKQTNPVDDKPIDFNKLKPEELMKYEIAKELGLFDKVMETGWKSLSAKETGRIGGLITKKKRELKQKEEQKATC
ncbi:MAG: small, acid-soluble spore protein, alpha/beta type [bacterium]|nr:small, acid-soluble spore protein, alpha/beta type [bacterium]